MSELLMEVKMYLGLSLPAGGQVYEAEFREWLRDVVDKVFDGYTITEAEGKWKGDSENSYVLTFITSTLEEYKQVIACANSYKSTFAQDSVLVTRHSLEGSVFV